MPRRTDASAGGGKAESRLASQRSHPIAPSVQAQGLEPSSGEVGAAAPAPRPPDPTAEHGEAVAAARRALSLLQSTLESTADGIVVISQQGRMVSHNQRFLRMWRLSAELLEAADQRPAV
ncbi:MAG TPA: PAS domain-containing protein, partial [Thermoanaerobaculia bacterium]|nr:PAS domain-containing protein [Thermoanaerobaculia bacterium]